MSNWLDVIATSGVGSFIAAETIMLPPPLESFPLPS